MMAVYKDLKGIWASIVEVGLKISEFYKNQEKAY